MRMGRTRALMYGRRLKKWSSLFRMMIGYVRRGRKPRRIKTNTLEYLLTAWEASNKVTVSDQVLLNLIFTTTNATAKMKALYQKVFETGFPDILALSRWFKKEIVLPQT